MKQYNVITNDKIIELSEVGTTNKITYNKLEIDSLYVDDKNVTFVMHGRAIIFEYLINFITLNGDTNITKSLVIIEFTKGIGLLNFSDSINENHIFNDNAERDLYFLSNLDERQIGVNIIVDGVLQVWTNTSWHEYSTPLTAQEIKSLYESNTDTEVLTTAKKVVLDKLYTDVDGNTVAQNSWIFPPNTIYIGLSAELSNALRALNIYDPILDKRGILLAQLYDENGSAKAFIYDIQSSTIVTANDVVGEVQNTTQFSRTPANDEIIRGFKILTNTPNTVMTANIIVRLTSHTGAEVYNVTINTTTDSLGAADIELRNPIITDAGLELFMEMNIPNMVGSQINNEFVPSHTATIQIIERKIIATEEYVNNLLGCLGAGYSIPIESTYCQYANQWYKVNIEFTPTTENDFVYDVSNKRWKYTGLLPRNTSIFGVFTGGHDDDNTRRITWEFRVNGQQVQFAPKSARIERNDDMSMSLMLPCITLNTNDYIELYTKVDSSYDRVETSNFNILIR